MKKYYSLFPTDYKRQKCEGGLIEKQVQLKLNKIEEENFHLLGAVCEMKYLSPVTS